MNKSIITVPRGIRYISEWKGFTLPEQPTIIDKQLTGCGFTEYCISCPKNVIVCSPRVILLENKANQHPGELMYVRNDLEVVLNVDNPKLLKNDNLDEVNARIDLEAEKLDISREEETANYYTKLRSAIRHYYLERCSQGKYCKFIVTYDSFRHVKEALVEAGVYNDFYVVVDEFQSIFTDSRFKSTTEIGFVNQLCDTEKLCYVSATPMIDKYLETLSWFKDLSYISLDWASDDPGRVIIPDIDAKPTTSIISSAKVIINEYLDGKFKKYAFRDESTGLIQEVLSTELVVYVNSVKNICDLIKKCGLTLDNTNVLCSRTIENNRRLKKAFGIKGSMNVIGSVPVKGESHKMFTLCTRTVYLGADFYSTCARSIVLSDSNVDCLAVDITLDLPQIMGRQRLDENPWKNKIELYFKSTRANKAKTTEEFSKLIECKRQNTIDLLYAYEDARPTSKGVLAKKYEDGAVFKRYLGDYVAVDIKTGVLVPVYNELVLLADMRAFEVQQLDYKDQFTVFNTLRDSSKVNLSELSVYLEEFDKLRDFQSKMKYVCDLGEDNPEILEVFLTQEDIVFRNFYYILGPKKIKALEYRKKELNLEYEKLFTRQQMEDSITTIIYDQFEVGKRYRRSDIKRILGDIFERFGVKNIVPKANMIEDYFDIKSVQINDPITKKRDKGFELIRKKGN